MARRSANGKDATTYKPIIDWVVRDLNLGDMIIRYRFKNYGSGGTATQFPDGTCLAEINNALTDRTIRHTIAHELRHIWQFKHNYNRDTWDGNQQVKIWRMGDSFVRMPVKEVNRLFTKRTREYDDLPWEKDANDYADRVLSDLILIPTRS